MQGVSHITFIVKDLGKAKFFFETIFDAKEVYDSGKQTFSLSWEKFFLIGELWIAVMEGDAVLARTYNHLALKISEEEFDLYEKRVKVAGVEYRQPRPRVAGEGQSLYFYDFDNHLFELHAGTLGERLARYQEKWDRDE